MVVGKGLKLKLFFSIVYINFWVENLLLNDFISDVVKLDFMLKVLGFFSLICEKEISFLELCYFK